MARRRKKFFDDFKHKTDMHKRNEVMALNNKFKDLQGYGVYCYLMELCGRELNGKIEFSKSTQLQLAALMNTEMELFREIIYYLDNVVKLINVHKVQGYLFLSIEELNRDAIKQRLVREAARNRQAERRLKLQKQHGIRIDNRETQAKKRKRILKEFDEMLILTDRIINDASLKYPHLGSIRIYFIEFVKHVKVDYREYWGKITHENYVTAFYMHLNQYKIPLRQALIEDGRTYSEMRNTRRKPIKFNLNE